jgi:hypothetical protein
MHRSTVLLALAVAVSGAPVLAQGQTMRAEFTAPQDGNREVVVDGRVWTCSGNACTAQGDDARPAVACRKLARKLGPVTRFATPQSELNTAGLATCNQDHK